MNTIAEATVKHKPALHTVKGARVFPCVSQPGNHGRYYGGVYGKETGPVAASFLSRNWGNIVEPMPSSMQAGSAGRSISGRCIFGGYVFLHYGHFLLESLSRIWALSPGVHDTIVWSHIQKFEEFTPDQLEVLAFWNLDKCNHVFSNNVIEVEELVVPEPGYKIQTYANPYHIEILGALEPTRVVPGKKLWLSRSKQTSKGGWVNEMEIEQRLESEGWTVYFPEEHSVRNQITEISSSERIAGSEGSAFHTVILCKSLSQRFDVFSRSHNFNDNYKTVGEAKSLRQYLHTSPVKVISKDKSVVRLEHICVDYLFECLKLSEKEMIANAPRPLPAELETEVRNATRISVAEASDTAKQIDVEGVSKIRETIALPSLDDCGIANNTVKASRFVNEKGTEVTGHNYLSGYEVALERFRHKPVTLMELGIGPDWNKGASLRMWRDYFAKGKIIGIDIRNSCKSENGDRIEVHIGDLGKIHFLRSIAGFGASLIIDDASHRWNHQILALCELFPSMPAGGVYIIENINTSFSPMDKQYGNEGEPTTYSFLKSIADSVASYFKYESQPVSYPEYQKQIALHTKSVTFLHSTCILEKK